MQPENLKSTANIAHLPLFFHHGVGSPGFGAWRELIANQWATRFGSLSGSATLIVELGHAAIRCS
jgi:hypothetical protein